MEPTEEAPSDAASQNRDLKVREAFQILTQGVEMIHYEVAKRNTKGKKIVWLDPDILRICVDVNRPSQSDRQKGKVPPGIYLRDIGEVRAGWNAYDFQHNNEPPESEELCLSLIGTERTVCLELPTKFSRDWFLERFKLIIDDVLTELEKSLRAKIAWTLTSDNTLDVEGGASTVSAQMRALLERGLQVLHHHPSGRIIRSYITFSEATQSLTVQPMERSFFDIYKKDMSIHVTDVAEIRPGTHSIGFVRTNSTDKQGECMSIIGTQCTIDIQLATNKSRDLLVQKLRVFVDSWKAEEKAQDAV